MSVFDIYSIIYSNFVNTSEIEYPNSLTQINIINQLAFSESGFDPTKQFLKKEKNFSRIMIFPKT